MNVAERRQRVRAGTQKAVLPLCAGLGERPQRPEQAAGALDVPARQMHRLHLVLLGDEQTSGSAGMGPRRQRQIPRLRDGPHAATPVPIGQETPVPPRPQ